MTPSLAGGQYLLGVYVNTHCASRRSKAPVTLVHKTLRIHAMKTHTVNYM